MGRLAKAEKESLLPGRKPVVDAASRVEFERKRAMNLPAGTASLADLLRNLWANVPAEEWDSIPHDGALNHDHYLYGADKVSGK